MRKSFKMVFLSLSDTCFLSKTSIVMSYSSFKSDAENAHIYITNVKYINNSIGQYYANKSIQWKNIFIFLKTY